MKVVIVGAGFAGLQCAQRLSGKPVDVLLIDRNNYHAFTPLLYQVASALLNPSETLIAQTLVWAAGVKPVELDTALDVRRTRFQRIAVDPCLRIPDCPGAFAIGDVAGVTQDGGELAMMLPQTMQEGRYVADAIVRLQRKQSLRPCCYRDKGIMATIGRHAAVAQVGPLSFKGPIGWFVWLFVRIYYSIGYRNRLLALISWEWSYVFYERYERPIRLITRGKDGAEAE